MPGIIKKTHAILFVVIVLFSGCMKNDFDKVEVLPDDFGLYYEEKAVHVDWGQDILKINPAGDAVFTKRIGFEMEMTDEFSVGDEKLLEIYNKALENGFFELQSHYEDPAIMDGGVRILEINGGEYGKKVTLVNYYTAETDELAGMAHKLIPQEIMDKNFLDMCEEMITDCSQDDSEVCNEWREYCG
ncbi:MAG: hypothetical protein ABIH76_05125 [Candidatus Bathyarchaeota archaeon]